MFTPLYRTSIERELSPAGAQTPTEFSDIVTRPKEPGTDASFKTQALRCGAAGARAGERLRRPRAFVRQAAEDPARGAEHGAHHGQPLRLL